MKHCLGSVRSFVLFAALCLLFAGCGDSVASVRHPSGDGRVPVRLMVAGMDSPSRTIAPEHVRKEDLADNSKYTVTLTGTSNMGDSISLNPAGFSFGLIGFDLSPGTWRLLLEATDVQTGQRVLSGSCVLVVQTKPVSTTVTLTPVTGVTGTVSVEFVLSKSIMEKLDKNASSQATITVALYDTLKAEVAGTKQVFSEAVPAGDSTTLTYNANNSQLAAGQYTIKLESGYTGPGPSGGTSVRYEMGHEDILYVEGNRETTASIALSSNSKELGTPDNPYRRDKAAASGNSPGNQFNTSESFSPWGETVWLYGATWDGDGNDTNGNEILVVDWDGVYNADYYEVEVLVHPFTKNAQTVTANGKFAKVVTTDAAWESLKSQQFTRNGLKKTPSYMRYSGNPADPDYYRTKTWIISCNDGVDFLSCADKNLAKTLFTTNGAAAGKANAAYRISGIDGFDNYGAYSYGGANRGKVGLEGDCGVIGILVPSFSPQTSLVFRVRAVNQYGHSSWVYWKGGKW